MSNDPIVDEIHCARNQIWDQCGQDIHGLIQRLISAESAHENRVVHSLTDIRTEPQQTT